MVLYHPKGVLKQQNLFQKSKENCSIHTSGTFMEQNRNLDKRVMASTMILSDNNFQHDLVMSHHRDTKHYCPLLLSYVSTVSLPLTQMNGKSGHFSINQKPRTLYRINRIRYFSKDDTQVGSKLALTLEIPGQQHQQLRVNLKAKELKESKQQTWKGQTRPLATKFVSCL